ncbi:hypothetical protein FGG08_002676 [Glutinoglossum americanum]|uniref:Uncharacterized protein n=1 Tax=Glutinoglossum americanum TaxID=1670608 RepID=A0A9P8I488_9PEZI|nr:hypothetical protein FGG08_002676 [Glutinoglossum americanum]
MGSVRQIKQTDSLVIVTHRPPGTAKAFLLAMIVWSRAVMGEEAISDNTGTHISRPTDPVLVPVTYKWSVGSSWLLSSMTSISMVWDWPLEAGSINEYLHKRSVIRNPRSSRRWKSRSVSPRYLRSELRRAAPRAASHRNPLLTMPIEPSSRTTEWLGSGTPTPITATSRTSNQIREPSGPRGKPPSVRGPAAWPVMNLTESLAARGPGLMEISSSPLRHRRIHDTEIDEGAADATIVGGDA